MDLMIQVISGIHSRRRLVSPKGDATRPTTSQMRQAVFNICQNQVEGSCFLDICAGSGSMGIEALSRGAKEATFIDDSHFAIEAIRQNIKALHLEDCSFVIAGDAMAALKKLEKQQKVFDLCYFDPPYSQKKEHSTFSEAVLLFLDKSSLLAPEANLYMEESAHFAIEQLPLKSLTLKNKRRFGNSNLYCFTTLSL